MKRPNLIIKAHSQLGEERSGTYVARTRIGTEKDGSPMYRYFRTVEEYKTYLKNQGSKDQEKKKDNKKLDTTLKEKTDKERKRSKKKQEEFNKKRSKKLVLKDKKGKKKEETKKSLLFVGVK